MKKVTCCNLDGLLNLKDIHELDDYLDDNENITVVLTSKVPYRDRDEGLLYMSAEDATSYINRGGRNFNIEVVNQGG